MSRITKQDILNRVHAAMQPPIQLGARQKASQQTFESLMQKAQQRRRAKPEIKLAPVQKADLKAKTPLPRREGF